jgi:hypothetical protein
MVTITNPCSISRISKYYLSDFRLSFRGSHRNKIWLVLALVACFPDKMLHEIENCEHTKLLMHLLHAVHRECYFAKYVRHSASGVLDEWRPSFIECFNL